MQAKPRAYEPHRLLAAIRGQARVLIVVGLVALFGGAAVARWAVPDLWLGRANARIGYEPHAVLSRANEALLVAAAAVHVGTSPAALAKQVHVRFQGRDRLTIEVRGDDVVRTRQVTRELADSYVALANARAEAAREDALGRARGAREQARLALERAVSPDQAANEARLRAQLEELDAAHQAALLAAPPPVSTADAADAQRQLSRMLASGAGEREVAALREKIAQARRTGTNAPALRSITARLDSKRAELRALQQASAATLPLREKLQAADDALRAVADSHPATRSSLEGAPILEQQSRLGIRASSALLAPMLAVLLLLAGLVLRELINVRVCEPTEVAHWLAVPVLTTSRWPRRPDALEPLVDALADPALESLGTTLLLPLSELERPLAGTLTKQLNARAQRQFRSRTGSRVTIAQEWQGELDSARIERAAQAADRVLWVVAADTHRGEALAARRALVQRKDGVAAVLVDAEPALVRSVGLAREFWKARPPAEARAPSAREQGAAVEPSAAQLQ